MTIKELAKELNRQAGTLARWATATFGAAKNGKPFGANSQLTALEEASLRRKSAGARRLKRTNSILYRGGLQQSLKLDGDNQAAPAPESPEEAPAVVEAPYIPTEAVEPPQPARMVSVEVTPKFAAYCTLLGKTPAEVLTKFAEGMVDHATNAHSDLAKAASVWGVA